MLSQQLQDRPQVQVKAKTKADPDVSEAEVNKQIESVKKKCLAELSIKDQQIQTLNRQQSELQVRY